MPSDGKGQGSGEGPRPDPNSGPASKPDPDGGPEVEKGGPQHVICMPPAAEEEKVSVTSAAAAAAAAAKKSCLSRSNSCQEECRICQQPSEELLIVLGCKCRGGLAKAHRSCVEVWFRTKGSNKCEICQQVAANVAPPESQQSTNYWVWRVDSAGGTNIGRGNHERQCFSPLWVAFAILIGGLLLDVLISISLGVSALPVNIIIGVLIVLGLGTAFRLVLECCQAWGSRRNAHVQRVDTIHGSHPAL